MMGSGIALLPAQLAAYGGISIISWIITLVGAVALAFVFAELGAEDEIIGGPPAYAKEVAPVFGFQSGVIYYIANWVGNIAIGITGISYMAHYFTPLNNPLTGSLVLIVVIWILTGINLLGGKRVSEVATVGVVLMLTPIVITAVGGWFWFSVDTYKANWIVQATADSSAGSSILQGVLLCLWAFIGIESASVSGTNIVNPKKTIPLATMIGVAFAGLVYIVSSQVMLGMFPAAELANSSAPFGLSMTLMIGPWAAVYMSIATTITCFTCLTAWMLLVGESVQTSAELGDFPKLFAADTKTGVPRQGLLLTSVFMSVVLLAFGLLRQGGDGMGEIFNDIINIAVLLTMIPYIYSAMNLIRFGEQKAKGFFIIAAAVVASIFCMVAILGGGATSIAGTFIVSLIFLLFYSRKEGKEQCAGDAAAQRTK
jgi:cadaverine:lysine antiporter